MAHGGVGQHTGAIPSVQSVDDVGHLIADHTVKVGLDLLEKRLAHLCGYVQLLLLGDPILLVTMGRGRRRVVISVKVKGRIKDRCE